MRGKANSTSQTGHQTRFIQRPSGRRAIPARQRTHAPEFDGNFNAVNDRHHRPRQQPQRHHHQRHHHS
ncbi:hypothetical protein [Dictyobacter kobayashii]|uniref:hypothetical protein n=1 Tax=Dictyobacter kobayashii TaxID=2014872 RepID=UPI0013870719|nr:hypothetical protein [Dictyobacter kobayashii]